MPGGTRQQQNFTMPENHNVEDVIEVTLEDLDEEQRNLVEANRDALTKLYLDSLSKTRGKVIQKNQLLTPSIMVTPTDQSAGTFGAASFQDKVDAPVHHALINQSGVLVNTLANLIQQVVDGSPEQQFGPSYFQVRLSAADKGKNSEKEMMLPKMPPSIPTPSS
jgi:hypothetical protein